MVVPVSALAATAEPADDGAGPLDGSVAAEEPVPFPIVRAIFATLLIMVLAGLAIGLALWGLGAVMTERNRELFYLVAVGVLTGLGFASVYIARQSVVSWGSLSYALLFIGLYLAAHVVARVAVPNADPYLLPMAGLMAAIGLTEIYRLDPTDAFRQGLWIVIGVALFAAAILVAAPRLPAARVVQVPVRHRRDRAAFLPRLPVIGETVNGARLWVHVGPLEFQPGELAKIFLIVFLAAYLREKREVLAQGRLKDLGPLLLIWGGADARARRDERPRLRAPLLRDLPRDALHRDRAALVRLAGLALFAAGGFAADRKIAHVHERITIWLHPWTTTKVFCPSTGGLALRQDCESYQLVKSLYSIGSGGFGGTGLGKGTFTSAGRHAADPLREDRLHLLGARAGARARRRRRRCCSCSCSSSRAG